MQRIFKCKKEVYKRATTNGREKQSKIFIDDFIKKDYN